MLGEAGGRGGLGAGGGGGEGLVVEVLTKAGRYEQAADVVLRALDHQVSRAPCVVRYGGKAGRCILFWGGRGRKLGERRGGRGGLCLGAGGSRKGGGG